MLFRSRQISHLLSADGLLVVEECDVEQNPFDILIADHLIHLSPTTITTLLTMAGFDALLVTTNWVGREISVIAKRSIAHKFKGGISHSTRSSAWSNPEGTMAWLADFVSCARSELASSRSFGIFGTSISGTWLSSHLDDEVDFFVDEDLNRIGRRHLGRPVRGPDSVDSSDSIYLALTPIVSRAIKTRMHENPARWVLPPQEPFRSEEHTSELQSH